MKEGDQVQTPSGWGRIETIKTDDEWVFGRRKPRPWVIVRYPNGKRQAWYVNALLSKGGKQ